MNKINLYLKQILPKLNESNLKEIFTPFMKEITAASTEKKNIGTYLDLQKMSDETKKKLFDMIVKKFS